MVLPPDPTQHEPKSAKFIFCDVVVNRKIEKRKGVKESMKERGIALFVVLIIVFLCSCANRTTTLSSEMSSSAATFESETISEPEPTSTEPTEAEIIVIEDCNNVFECLSNVGFDLVYTIIYDDTNDPNGTGEHPYYKKASFIDGRIVDNCSEESQLSGTIELFATPDQAVERAMALSDTTYQRYAAQILSGACLLRLGYDYSEEEILKAAKSIGGVVYSNLNSSEYDSLDSTYQIGSYSFPISDEWEIKNESNNLLYLYPNDSNGWITVKYNSGIKITSNYLTFIQGALDGSKATFVSAEVTTVEDSIEAIKFLGTTEVNGDYYYMTTVAFDVDHGHYSFVLIEPIATVDKVEVYFDELIAGIIQINS